MKGDAADIMTRLRGVCSEPSQKKSGILACSPAYLTFTNVICVRAALFARLVNHIYYLIWLLA